MPLEAATSIAALVPTNPDGLDSKSEGDNHIRMLKSVLQLSFPGLAGRLGRFQAKTANYDLVLNDNWSTIVFAGGSPNTLGTTVAASVLGNGYYATVVNAGSTTIAFDPSGGETVNGVASVSIPSLHMAHLWTDGANWLTAVLPLTPIQAVPPGTIAPYAGFTAPTGWLMCDGSTQSRTTFAALFSIIGGNYGAPSGTTFSLPDLRGRAIFGPDGGTGRTSSVLGAGVGSVGGNQFMQSHGHGGVTGTENQGHSHAPAAGTTFVTITEGGDGASVDITIGPHAVHRDAGSGAAQSTAQQDANHNHNIASDGSGNSQNIPPAIVLNYIIKT